MWTLGKVKLCHEASKTPLSPLSDPPSRIVFPETNPLLLAAYTLFAQSI